MSILPTPAPSKRWTRSYPPLALLGVAVLVAVLILPSSLNLPQSNPSTVLEYAPVPPQDENPPPPADGNLSSLGLGSSNTLAAPIEPPPPPPLDTGGLGARPNQKQCVGNPPRQTEDPSSPPCVPFFEGDNFGATYQGVTKDEIVVLAYFEEAIYGLTGRQETSPPAGTYVDIDKPPLPNCPPDNGAENSDPNQCDHLITRMVRAFSKYFNNRFQTYGRHVHYWLYFTGGDSAAERRGDAVANWEKLRPFAVIDAAQFTGFNEDYQEAMAKLGVLSFSSQLSGLANEFYRRNAPLAWGLWPDVEHSEKLFASYVCQKVAPYPTRRFNGGIGPQNGQPRKFGIYYPVDPGQPGMELYADLLLKDLEKCGVEPVVATYANEGFTVDASDRGTDATQAVARFSNEGVTTVLLVGTEGRFSVAADAVRYYPEIVVAGDLDNDNNYFGQVQNQNTWRNAWAVTYHTRINRLEDAPGYRAFREGYPSAARGDSAGIFARDEYGDHFMLFQAIQVAGPKLTPEAVDKGFHAIPENTASSPYVPAFFFDPGDYTSVKDGAEQWWDPNGRSRGGGTPSNRPGCWRMAHEGKRSLAGEWFGKDDVFRNPTDPCNGYDGGVRIQPNP
jgi:hypothetical protein